MRRRSFLIRSAAAVVGFPWIGRAALAGEVLGQGEFRYRVVPGWGQLGESTPVDNCHGIVCDRAGNILLLTDETKNNVIVYDPRGRLLHKWGTTYPGAHGLSLVEDTGREVLYFTDLKRHRVFKATPSGELLGEWGWPEKTGKYPQEDDYRPSWTLHLPDGGFFILDGYGRDYITRHRADGSFDSIFGGQEGGITHWGPHGGMVDVNAAGTPTLLIAMSDQQYLLRLDLQGKPLGRVPLPGGNPRQIRKSGRNYFLAHLGDNWPADRNSRGFVSVLDERLRVVSNVGGTGPEYGDAGILRPMKHTGERFLHPHDLAVGRDGSLYVAQFASGKTYPIKLERV